MAVLMKGDAQYLIGVIERCFNSIAVVNVNVQVDHPQTVLYHFGNAYGWIIQVTESGGPIFHCMVQATSNVEGNLLVFFPDLADAFKSGTGD
jgi:hypothetical protein